MDHSIGEMRKRVIKKSNSIFSILNLNINREGIHNRQHDENKIKID